MMTLTCSLCGKTYTEHAYRVGPLHECRYHPRKRPSPDAVPKRRRKTKSHLALCIEEARARGLSYGQYMAWKFTKGESEV